MIPKLFCILLTFVTGCQFWDRVYNTGFTSPPREIKQLYSASTSKWDSFAYYELRLRGMSVGTALMERKTSTQEQSLEIKLFHKIGHTKLITVAKAELLKQESQRFNIHSSLTISNKEQLIGRSKNNWVIENGYVYLQSNDIHAMPELMGTTFSAQEKVWDQNTSIIFKENNNNTDDQTLFLPFFGSMQINREEQVVWDKDGFAKRALMAWGESIELELVRTQPHEVTETLRRAELISPNLFWIVRTGEERRALQQLKEAAEKAVLYGKNAESRVLRENAEVPYILHRKIINFRDLSERIVKELDFQGDYLTTMNKVISAVRFSHKENDAELPYSMTHHPDWLNLEKDEYIWQWPFILKDLIAASQLDIDRALSIEEDRKSDISVRVQIPSMIPRSVVKTQLNAIDAQINIRVETATKEKTALSLHSLNDTDLLDRPVYGPAFAAGLFEQLDLLCKKNKGRISLDLNHLDSLVFKIGEYTGLWTESERLKLVRQFAFLASTSDQCMHISFLAPTLMHSQIQEQITDFKRTILQQETRFQVSNGSSKKLKLLPGNYEVVVSSMVTGQVIGKKKIEVPAKKTSQISVSF